ncbi:MFS transporter fmqE [Fusarium oxysporum f. sp. cubense]|uniref:MFS transporter fmqE n=1 Tax=Fusarium oxysporum f. sp. cubense TaxID=61366 RepID=A0A559LM85_FUSOC|nr:MFS transporter fmqE [Fusarium oxysporum f. sp. cubense]
MDSKKEATAMTTAEHLELQQAEDHAEAAANQIAYEKTLSFAQSVRVFWRSTLWILYVQLVVFGYGIDGIIAGNLLAIPKFREDYGTTLAQGDTTIYIIPATWQSLYGGVSQLAAVLGAAITGWLADRIGRRYTNMLFCAISIVGVGLQYHSTRDGSLPILTVGKAINGLSIGAWLIIGPLYASEVAPLKLRGWLTAMTNFIQFCGTLLFTGIMYKLGPRNDADSYIVPFACQWIIPAIVLPTVWLCPESPVWLVRAGRRDAAVKSLDRLHGDSKDIDKKAILAVIEQTIQHEQDYRSETSSVSYASCFQKPDRQRTLISMFIYGCQYLSGIIFVLGYQSYYYQLAGFGAQMSFLLSMLNNCSMFVANILSWPLLTVVGRRPLIVWGQFICAITLFIVGGASLPGSRSTNLVTIAFMFVWGFVYQITLGTVAWTVVAEIPTWRLRSRTQGLSNIVLCIVQWLIGFVFPYMFNPDAGNLGGKVGFIFGATTLIGFAGCWVWLPETKNRTTAELDDLYAAKVKPRHFHKTHLGEAAGSDDKTA